jgi:hypothetical protein
MRKSAGNRKMIFMFLALQVIHQPLFRLKEIRAGEYAGGRKIGLERVIDQEKRREQGKGSERVKVAQRNFCRTWEPNRTLILYWLSATSKS